MGDQAAPEGRPGNAPDTFQRILFISSLVALFVALWIWFAAFVKPFKVIYEQLGMTELPAPTELALALGTAISYALPIIAVVLILIGVFALKRAKRKTLLRLTAVNWIITALIPGYVYFCVHLPLIELQKKLGGG